MIQHVNGIDLFYEVKGTGDPLLMVHGNSEDHTIFDEAAEVLKDRFTVYLVDSRDHGQSTKGKPFNITVIQIYAPTSNTEEAEVERFYEDLQDLLEHPKKMSFSL